MKSVLFYTLLTSIMTAASAITCYNCQGEGCEDPFDQTGVSTTCTRSSTLPNNYCRKTVVGTSVTRSCGILNTCTPGCSSSTCTYCCESNLCNGGTSVTNGFLTMGVAVVAAFIFTRQ